MVRGPTVIGLGWVIAALLAGGCSLLPPILPATEAPPVVVEGDFCAGIGMDALLRGDPDDPRQFWLEGRGGRTDVSLPDGHIAAFGPAPMVLDPGGAVVMRGGDFVFGVCVVGDELVLDPDSTVTLDCGPMPEAACHGNVGHVVATQPGRRAGDVAMLQFTSAQGDYVVTFKDGSTAEGQSNLR